MKRQIKRLLILHKNKGKKIRLSGNCNVTLSSVFEGCNNIMSNSSFNGYLGYGTYIGRNCHISGKIGRYCSISDSVVTVNGRHPTSVIATTHPAFYSVKNCVGLNFCNVQQFEENVYADAENKYDVIIGNDVWIGYNVTILSGVKIGDGAIIAAGAVVTGDVTPYSIVGGIPAKHIKFRFNEEHVSMLLKTKWWERDNNWLRNNCEKFVDVSQLLSVLNDCN